MSGRIRTIKPEFLEDEKLCAMPVVERLLFPSLWLLADDHGNLRGNHAWIHSQVFWGDSSVTVARVTEALARLSRDSLVTLYTVHGQSYLAITNWTKHQRVDKPGQPRVPGPDQADKLEFSEENVDSRDSRETVANGSRDTSDTLATDLRSPISDLDHDRESTRANRDDALLPRAKNRFEGLDTACPDTIEPLSKTLDLIREQKLPPVADILDTFISSRRSAGRKSANWPEDFHAYVRKWNLNEQRAPKKQGSSARSDGESMSFEEAGLPL